MTNTPASSPTPVLTFVGKDKTLFSIDPREVVQTPRGRRARLMRAAIEALPTALALREKTLSQGDEDTLVVMLIAVPDCDLGRSIIEKTFNNVLLAQSLCGPLVQAFSPAAFIQLFGDKATLMAEQINALGAQPQEVVFAFAVNGMTLEICVMRPGTATPTEVPSAPPAPSASAPAVEELAPPAPEEAPAAPPPAAEPAAS